jgi:C4-dicarboxylate transporter/malic acid transport protein
MTIIDLTSHDGSLTPVTAPSGTRGRARRRLLAELEHPAEVFANVSPNWFASVMGTGIVANAAMLLPSVPDPLRTAALVVWVAAALWLAVLVAATAVHWARHSATARGHALDPAMAPFYGAPAMALLTVGAGALLVGRDLIGAHAAVVLDSVLWSAGTATGLAAAGAIPYLMFTRHRIEREMTLASWLMPIVPPMVSAATGAALIPHLAGLKAQQELLLGCYAMFGLSLIASIVVITLVWGRLVYDGPGACATVPTLWIVLGPLGQSVTAANLLATQARRVMPAPYGTAFHALGLIYGVPVWGFAVLWLGIAAAITAATMRRHLPFTLGWWSFTFPVGTVVTGTSQLALHTNLPVFQVAAEALYALLVLAFATVAARTARGLLTGRLLRLPALMAGDVSSHLQNAAAGPLSAGRVRETARSERRSSTPATGSAASAPVESSSSTARGESNAKPPEIRARLSASVLETSSAGASSKPAAASPASATARVPEPGSRAR